MSCLVWNYRGLGNLRTEKELGVLVRAKDLSIMFLAETWSDEARLKDIKSKLEFDQVFVVPWENRGGDLALFWKNSIDVTMENFSKNHIDTIINKGKEDAWRFTGFYGEPVTHLRHEAWAKLRQLNSRLNLPWLCVGDFNEILRSNEKLGGSMRSQSQMQLFQDVVDEYGFLDLGFVGPQFTWSKHYAAGHLIWERLDRGLTNYEWLTRFTRARVHHFHSHSSDHRPLLITLTDLEVARKKKVFKFEEIWLSDKGCSDIVEAVWLSNESGFFTNRIMGKIEKCGVELTKWSHEKFGNVRNELEKKRRELAEAERSAMELGLNTWVRELKKEIENLLDRENRMWLQRSKTQWAENGDRNTQFFHSKAANRYRKNYIHKLRRPNGQWSENNEQVADIIIKYYKDLFTSANPMFPEEVLLTIETRVSAQMNEKLSTDFKA